VGSKLADIPHERTQFGSSTRRDAEGIVLDLTAADFAPLDPAHIAIGPATWEDGAGNQDFAAAEVAGVAGVYLLTTDATAWFLRLGLEHVPRGAAPSELMASPEFVDACPASAACLWASSKAQLRLSQQ